MACLSQCFALVKTQQQHWLGPIETQSRATPVASEHVPDPKARLVLYPLLKEVVVEEAQRNRSAVQGQAVQ